MEDCVGALINGGVGVIPTDTIYGVVASAHDRKAVERVYEVKGRNSDKPFIILIGSIDDVGGFGVKLGDDIKAKLDEYWPGPISIILPSQDDKYEYLHRGTQSLAFRLPDKQDLITLLKLTGPLIAPSANPEGLPPAKDINQAKEYFGDELDFYIDGGDLEANPSKLLKLEVDGSIRVIRD